MPPILSKPSKAAHMAIIYVTVGALLMVWSGIWYVWMINNQSADQPHNAYYYWCAVVFFSGLTVFIIGLALGRIGRAARRAEMPPEVSPGEHTAQPAVAATAAAPQMMPNGQAFVPGQVGVPGQPIVMQQPGGAVQPVAPTARVR